MHQKKLSVLLDVDGVVYWELPLEKSKIKINVYSAQFKILSGKLVKKRPMQPKAYVHLDNARPQVSKSVKEYFSSIFAK